ncbi:MAG: hypothetical protein ABID38_04580 [Candidatus Diapherotrites archaeon]
MKKALCLLIIVLLLNTTYASTVSFQAEDSAPEPDAVSETIIDQFVCEEPKSLTPEEANNILDVVKGGFNGAELDSGAPAIEDREEMEGNEVIIVSGDSNSAVKAEMPNKKMEPWEMSHILNNYIDGAYAFGIVLEDTLRAGRCNDIDYNVSCALTGGNLFVRTSGAGIVNNVKNVATDFSKFWKDEEDFKLLTPEENADLRSKFESQDPETFDYQTLSREKGRMIDNTILAEGFEAEMQTNSGNPSSVINTYSVFDKYFNAYASTEMVFSSFGPATIGATTKMFGWTKRRGIFNALGARQKWDDFMDFFRRRLVTHESFLGDLTMHRMHDRIDHNGWRQWFQDMVVGKDGDTHGWTLSTTQEFQDWWGEMSKKGGFLDNIKSPQAKKDFVKTLTEMRSFARAGDANLKAAKEAYKAASEGGLNTPAARSALIDYGRATTDWMMGIDDGLKMDMPEYMVKNHSSQFWNKGIRNAGTGEIIDLYKEHRHMRVLFEKFSESGNWKGMADEIAQYNVAYQTDDVGNLILYAFDPSTAVKGQGLSYSNLQAGAKQFSNKWAKTDYGEFVPYNPGSVKLIQGRLSTNAELFDGQWAQSQILTPEEFSLRITNPRVGRNIHQIPNNIDQMLDTVKERNFGGRGYWNALDKLMAEEDELIKTYFSIKGGVKWTAIPYGYWWAKKGAGFENISYYQLPDSWFEVKFLHRSEPIYNDAFMDFFANEGSDQGDIFVQVLNKLPYKLVLDQVSDNFGPFKELYDKLSKNEIRSETENLAYYLSRPSDCPNCSITLKSDGLKDFSPYFTSTQEINSYILEDTRSETAKNKGQTIIAYSHHTNLTGQTEEIDSGETERGDTIDLVEAQNERRTCSLALEDLTIGDGWLNIGKVLKKITPSTAGVGGLLVTLESISYATFLWSGVFTSVAIQLAIAPQLQDCVDDEEGYYVHYFVAAKKEAEKNAGASERSTDKVSEFVDNLGGTVKDAFGGDSNSFTKDAAEDLGKEIDQFVNNAEDNDIVQATLKLKGQTTGGLTSKKLFYFWCGPNCEMSPSVYKTEGKMVVTDTDTGQSLVFDNEKGELSLDGKVLVSNEDAVRLSVPNGKIPAIEIPQTLSMVCVVDSNSTIFEISADGKTYVRNDDLLDCIQGGVEAQTGLPLDSDELSEAFGRAESIRTDSHPSISLLNSQIVAEGIPRRVAPGENSRVIIKANKDVELIGSGDGFPDVGSLESIEFKNGTIVVKDDGCFLIWLKHHEGGILLQNLADGLKANLTTSTNPETQCEEPAIDLEVKADPDSDFAQAKVDNFNQSLEHLGPFQVFDTATKRFVLYSDEDCNDHMKVIDKETGEVKDFVGEVVNTPTGIKFTDETGKEHTIDFSAENGVPTITYNDGTPETLTSAQGRNGAFYYDPDNGLWYAENAQLLPLIDAFKQLGFDTRVGEDGKVTTTAQGNVLNVDLGGDGGGLLNLPSLPESLLLLLVFMVALSVAFVIIRKRQSDRAIPI